MHHQEAVDPTSRPHVEHVEIRTRKIVSDDTESTILVVQCPKRHRSVRLEECVTCSYCKGLHTDPETEKSFLVCEVDEGASSGRVPAGRPAPTSAELSTTTSVGQIMSRDVVCVSADMELETLTQLFLERGFSGAPVVDEGGHPIGIVSKTDVLRARHETGDAGETRRLSLTRGGYEAPLGPGFHLDSWSDVRVRDIMMPLTFALPQGESVARAAALMAFEGVHRVAVVGPDGDIVGIVSSLDVLKWLARQAGFVVGG